MAYDLLFQDALLVDGSGAAPAAGDLAVEAGRIARIAPAGAIPAAAARRAIPCAGLALAPGFIDTHTHDDRAVLDDPAMRCKISQGVTTVVVGNCGISLAPLALAAAPPPPLNLLGGRAAFAFPRFADYAAGLAAARPAVNVAALVGHGSLRVGALADITRPASEAERAVMRARLAASLEQGAIGFSTGLYYPINAPADADEVADLAGLLPAHDGVYATHMRDESVGVLASLEESFATARRARVPVVISHHKCAQPENWGRSVETLPVIERASATQEVGLDAYPYHAGSTVLDPRHVRPDVRVRLTWSEPYPELAGRELAAIAADWNLPLAAAAERLLPAGAIYFQMDEADVRRILAFPLTMIGSDGLPHDAHPHPRLWGTFARVLGHYSRDLGLFPLAEAVRKMTSLPAARFRLAGRGLLREAYHADLVLFDPARVRDRATYDQPRQEAEGIARVMVNGALAWPEREAGARAGILLRRGG